MDLSPWHRACTKEIFIPKGSYGHGETRKCIPLVGAITPLFCAGRQNTPSRGRWYRAPNGKLPKLGRTYRHDTVLAPKKYLYQKEATGMDRAEMYSASLCNNASYLCGPSIYPISREAV